MAGHQYSLTEYREWVRRSKHKRLLVEGPDDKRLFRMLIEAFNKDGIRVDIDTADLISGDGSKIGNCEKVEKVSALIGSSSISHKFVGFVDREFREFELGETIRDKCPTHKINNRLIWSRGHSIENYYFDFSTLKNPLEAFSVTDVFDKALVLFQKHFDAAIKFACAASLAGREIENLKIIRSSVYWEMFEFRNSKLLLNTVTWRKKLITEHKLSSELTNKLIEKFELWVGRVAVADKNVVRWLCHGHTGLAFIWAVYGFCISEVCRKSGYSDANNVVQRILKAEERVRFNTCAKFWIDKALGSQSSYPIDVLTMLGIQVS